MKLTTTDIERKKCFEYLTIKGLHPIAPNYVYTERDGKITACCGIMFVGMTEPFASDNNLDGLQLFSFAQGIISTQTQFTVAMANTKVKDILKKLGFYKWSLEDSEIYIKET